VQRRKDVLITSQRRHITVSFKESVKNGEDGPLSLEEILPALGSTPEEI
jgi:hypothetical protein